VDACKHGHHHHHHHYNHQQQQPISVKQRSGERHSAKDQSSTIIAGAGLFANLAAPFYRFRITMILLFYYFFSDYFAQLANRLAWLGLASVHPRTQRNQANSSANCVK